MSYILILYIILRVCRLFKGVFADMTDDIMINYNLGASDTNFRS